MTDIIDSVKAQWEDAVARWQQAVADFDAAILEHYNLRAMAEAANDLPEWQETLDRALRVKTAIEMLGEKLQGSANWFKTTFGFGALGLPVIGLVPVAVILGSISAVVSVTYALYAYRDQLAQKWQYIEAHPDMSPAQVTDLLNADAGILAGAGNVAMWIVIGGIALLVLPKLIKGPK